MSSVQARSSGSTNLVLNSSSVSLPQWLDISWFYPRGFHKERIIETPKSWIVLGREIVYKFLKVPDIYPPLEPLSVFRERWKLAAEEVLDNAPLAPNLYLGLRLLRWIDDEPEWMSEKPNSDLDPNRPPSGADDVAIVMLRLPQDRMFDSAIKNGTVSERRVQAAASKLRAFHRAPPGKKRFFRLREGGPFSSTIVHRYLRPLENFILSDGSFLDPFSRIACREIHGALRKFVEDNQSLLNDRVKARAVVDCHGSLRADRMAMLNGNDLAIFGRLRRDDPRRIADYLTDVAAVTADLEARGSSSAAAKFEERYFGRKQSAQDPLYLFYKTAEAVTRAQVLFRGQADDLRVQAPSYLALAFRLALGLHRPFLIVLGGTDEPSAQRLGRGISELTGSSLLTPEMLPISGSGTETGPIHLERILHLSEHRAAVGRNTVILWPLNREEERLRMQRAARASGIDLLFVSVDRGRSGHFGNRPLRSTAADFAQTIAELDTPHLLIEPSLPQADLCLYILHELKRGVVRRRSIQPNSTSRIIPLPAPTP